MSEISPLLWRKQDVAKAANLSIATIDRHTHPRGRLRCVRVGGTVRYAPADVQAWIEELRLGVKN
jgi:hypothetical protein